MAEMKEMFYSSLAKLPTSGNSVRIEDQKYEEIVQQVIIAKGKTTGKTPPMYKLLKRYDIVNVLGLTKLISPLTGDDNVRYFVKYGDLFDLIYESHVEIGHKGCDAMVKHVNRKYVNITYKEIQALLQCCRQCLEKRKMKKKGLVVKSMVFHELNSRCQVDLIDYQTCPSEQYKFIMVYQDHLTKFCILRALKTKTAEEVAYNLLDPFTLLGAPVILQSDNGREFINRIINSLKEMWSDLKLVSGKPRHSQSNGSVERANQNVENSLTTWMADNHTKNGTRG